MRDIESFEDIVSIVDAFYTDIDRDDLLGRYFASLDMESHLPRMYAFWSSVVFQTGTFQGRPFDKHARLAGLEAKHFERWVERFLEIVDERFEGAKASLMKARSAQVAWAFSSRLCDEPIDASLVARASGRPT